MYGTGRWFGVAEMQLLGNEILVNGVCNGLADPNILELRLAQVELEEIDRRDGLVAFWRNY